MSPDPGRRRVYLITDGSAGSGLAFGEFLTGPAAMPVPCAGPDCRQKISKKMQEVAAVLRLIEVERVVSEWTVGAAAQLLSRARHGKSGDKGKT